MSEQKSKIVNSVHDDAIRRQMIKSELDWQLNWPNKWGFMMAAYNELDAEKKQNTSSTAANHLPAVGTAGAAASNLPTRSERLVADLAPITSRLPEDTILTDAEMKSFYLLTHNINRLQKALGGPRDKYTFPPTKNSEIGWWTMDAQERLDKVEKAAGKQARFDEKNMNTLLDVKMRFRK